MTSDTTLDYIPEESTPVAPPAKPARLLSLDIFRGATIAGMILVNNSSKPSYPPFGHADWDGLTPTDLVFPFFVFIVGAAVPFSMGNRREGGSGTGGLLVKIVRRTLLILGIGLLLNGLSAYLNQKSIRIPGVLQRLAICYFFASTLALAFKPKVLAWLSGIMLVGYALAMTFIPVPGGTAGDLSKPGNLAAYIDRTLLGSHTYRPEYDPEGILSTIPAIAGALIGVLAGLLIRSKESDAEKVAKLTVGGVCVGLLGYFWSATFPINKALWSPPFTLITAGYALLLLGTLYWLVDVKGWKTWSWPFKVFGMNALAAYVLSGLLAITLGQIKVTYDGNSVTLRSAAAKAIASVVTNPKDASLCYALAFDLVCFFFIWIMYKKKIFLKA